MVDKVKLLICGLPGTPIFELGERLAVFHNMDLYTIEVEPVDGSYFQDKVPTVRIDTGDFMTGSESQQHTRDPYRQIIDYQLDNLKVENPLDGLNAFEKEEILQLPEGIVVSEIKDPDLLDWATNYIELGADTNEAVNWFVQRRKCYSCGAVFHMEEKPPMVPGICDRCGTDLKRKPEDDPEFVKKLYKHNRRSLNRMKERCKDNCNYIKLMVDQAKSFEDILNLADRWMRKTTGISGYEWSYLERDTSWF